MTSSPNKSLNNSMNNSIAGDNLTKFEKGPNKKLQASLRDMLLLEVCKTENLNIDQKQQFETETSNILSKVKERIQNGEKRKENQIVIQRLHQKIQHRQLFSQKSFSSLIQNSHFQILGLDMPRLAGTDVSSNYSSPRLTHQQSRSKLDKSEDFMKINQIQLNKMSVAQKKNTQFQSQINEELMMAAQIEVPQFNFGRVRRERMAALCETKTAETCLKSLNLQIDESQDVLSRGQKSHELNQVANSNLTNKIQLIKFPSQQNKRIIQKLKEPSEQISVTFSQRESLDQSSVSQINAATSAKAFNMNMDSHDKRAKQIQFLKISTKEKQRFKKKNEIKQSMKFIRILGKNLREELKKKGQRFLELQKQQKLKEAKLKKKQERMQRKASEQLILNSRMMAKKRIKGKSSSNLYQNTLQSKAQLKAQLFVNRQDSLKQKLSQMNRQSSLTKKQMRGYYTQAQSAGLRLTETNLKIGPDVKFITANEQELSQSVSSESLQSSTKDKKRLSQISLSQSSSGLSSRQQSKKHLVYPKRQLKTVMPEIDETMADMNLSRNDTGENKDNSNTENRQQILDLSRISKVQLEKSAKTSSLSHSMEEIQQIQQLSCDNPFMQASHDTQIRSISSKSNLVMRVDLFQRASFPQRVQSVPDSLNQVNEVSALSALQNDSQQEEEEYYCEDSSEEPQSQQMPQSKISGLSKEGLSSSKEDKFKSKSSDSQTLQNSNLKSKTESKGQQSSKSDPALDLEGISSVQANTKESEIRSTNSLITDQQQFQQVVDKDQLIQFAKGQPMQEEYAGLKTSKFRQKENYSYMNKIASPFANIMIRDNAASSQVLSDQSSQIDEDVTPKSGNILSGSDDGGKTLQTLQEQQFQIIRIKNQSLSSISEEQNQDGEQTYTPTITSQGGPNNVFTFPLYTKIPMNKHTPVRAHSSKKMIYEYDMNNRIIEEDQQISSPFLYRHKTSQVVPKKDFETDLANQLAEQLSADGSESPVSNSKTVSSKNFIIKSQTSEISQQSKDSSQISVNQMVPIVFKNLSPEYAQRKLDKQNFNSVKSPTRNQDCKFDQNAIYATYNTAQPSQNSPTHSKQDAGCQGTPFSSDYSSPSHQPSIDQIEFDIVNKLQVVDESTMPRPNLQFLPSDEEIEELESDSSDQKQSNQQLPAEVRFSQDDSDKYEESLVSDSSETKSKAKKDSLSNTNLSESLSSDDNENVFSRKFQDIQLDPLIMHKKKRHENDIQITMSPMITRNDINISDCELSELEEFYLTEIEQQQNYDLIEKLNADKQKIMNEIKLQQQKLSTIKKALVTPDKSAQSSYQDLLNNGSSNEVSHRQIMKESEKLKNLKIKLKRHETKKQVFAFNGDQSDRQLSDHNIFQRLKEDGTLKPLNLKQKSNEQELDKISSLGLIQIAKQPNSSLNLLTNNRVRNLGCESTKELGSRSRGTSFKLILRRNTSKDIQEQKKSNIMSSGNIEKLSGHNDNEQALSNDNKMVQIESSVTISSQSLTSPVGYKVTDSMQNHVQNSHSNQQNSHSITKNITAQLTSFPNSSSGKTNKKSSSHKNQLTMADIKAEEEQDGFVSHLENKRASLQFQAQQRSSLHEVKENNSNFKESSTTSQNLALGESDIQPSFRGNHKELKHDEILIDSFSENQDKPYCSRVFSTIEVNQNNQDDIKLLIKKLNQSSEEVSPISHLQVENTNDQKYADQLSPIDKIKLDQSESKQIHQDLLDNSNIKSNQLVIDDQNSDHNSSDNVQFLDDFVINQIIEIQDNDQTPVHNRALGQNLGTNILQQTFKSSKSSNHRRGHQMVHQRKQASKNRQSTQNVVSSGQHSHNNTAVQSVLQEPQPPSDEPENLVVNSNHGNNNTAVQEEVKASEETFQNYQMPLPRQEFNLIEESNIIEETTESKLHSSFQTMIDTKQPVNTSSANQSYWAFPQKQAKMKITPMKMQHLLLSEPMSGSQSPDSREECKTLSAKNDAAQRLQSVQFMSEQLHFRNLLHSTQNKQAKRRNQFQKTKTMKLSSESMQEAILKDKELKYMKNNHQERASRNQLKPNKISNMNNTQHSLGHKTEHFTPINRNRGHIDTATVVFDNKILFQHLQSDNSQRIIPSTTKANKHFQKFEIFSPKNQRPKATKDVIKDIGQNLKSLMQDVDNIQIPQSYTQSQNKSHRIEPRSPTIKSMINSNYLYIPNESNQPYGHSSIESNVRSTNTALNIQSNNFKNSLNNISIIEPQTHDSAQQSPFSHQRFSYPKGLTKNNTTQLVWPATAENSLKIEDDSPVMRLGHQKSTFTNKIYTQPSMSLNQFTTFESPKLKMQPSEECKVYQRNPEENNRLTFGGRKQTSTNLSQGSQMASLQRQRFQRGVHDRHQSLYLNIIEPMSQNEISQNNPNRRSRNAHQRQYSTVQSPHSLIGHNNLNNRQQFRSRGHFSPQSNTQLGQRLKSPSQISSLHQNLMEYQYSSDSNSLNNRNLN